jgi:hypothetical protein
MGEDEDLHLVELDSYHLNYAHNERCERRSRSANGDRI